MISKLIKENYITFENYFLDGTKIEADANKYSFVWKKSTAKFEAKLKEKIQETLQHIHELTELEAGTEEKEAKQNTEITEEDLGTVAKEIVALAHNILKVAGLRQLLSENNPDNDPKNTKAGGEKRLMFLHLLYFRDLSDSPLCYRRKAVAAIAPIVIIEIMIFAKRGIESFCFWLIFASCSFTTLRYSGLQQLRLGHLIPVRDIFLKREVVGTCFSRRTEEQYNQDGRPNDAANPGNVH